MREHADEMHRPDAATHGDGADDKPAVAQAGVAYFGNSRGKLQEGVAAEGGDQIRQQDQCVIVRSRESLRRIDVQSEVVR